MERPTPFNAAPVNGYDTVFAPPARMVKDVCYWLNRAGQERFGPAKVRFTFFFYYHFFKTLFKTKSAQKCQNLFPVKLPQTVLFRDWAISPAQAPCQARPAQLSEARKSPFSAR